MTSPNIQIQNLMRRYVKERDANTPDMIKFLISSSNVIIPDNSFKLENILQTNLLYNFKQSFEYTLNIEQENENEINEEDIFLMDEEKNNNITDFENLIIDNLEYKQYLGNGILYNIYGAKLVDEKWILYGFIISKIYKLFKRNILNEDIKINSLHIGIDNGGIQSVFNHLFSSSELFSNLKINWNWTSLSRNNELYSKYKKNFISLLPIKPYWEQIILIINKLQDITDKYNLLIFQINTDNPIDILRKQYLFTIIMALRFLDNQGVLLMEFPIESKWGILETNILALCALIFDDVYLTKYEIGKIYNIIVCKEKKKNLSTTALIKKLIKIMYESSTCCIILEDILTSDFINQINKIKSNLQVPIDFSHIIQNLKTILLYNETQFI
jgi:hypothetical protein